ncbi:MAG: hypothetical protein IJ593_08485 [Lachnospiraceae bacterium]|nr:hypothetical protein [Lachnospiraceae bacterium]
MKKLFVKSKFLFIISAICIVFFVFPAYCLWGKTDKGGIFWYDADGTFAINGWKIIDDDNDGIGYYYYFNENGFALVDDITPDYMIVDNDGKRLDMFGKPEEVKVENIDKSDFGDSGIFSAEILAQIEANSDVSTVKKGFTSSGAAIRTSDVNKDEGPSPADNIVIEVNADGTARSILGLNVVLKDKSNEKKGYNAQMERKMSEYIKGGDKYSKKVNGTIFNKTKWKEVMALKGTGATITFENPSNNFNKIKGRIATHYFTYSDRTTICTLSIYNDDTNEELYTTSEFNYNSGTSFECVFPRKANVIRFELEVTGQYTSRICYLRNCEFGFDREAYEDELYEDEIEEEYRRKYGTDSNAEEDEEEEFSDLGEIPLEGEDPGARYRRLNNISDDDYLLSIEYDEEDDSISAELRASISEARKKRDEENEARDRVSGPAFDKNLVNETEALGPDGSSRFVAASEGGED